MKFSFKDDTVLAQWTRGEVANTAVCKTAIRGCKSRRGLKKRPGGGMVYAHDLKSCLERDVGSIPTPGTRRVSAL